MLLNTPRLELRPFAPRHILTLMEEPERFAERFGAPPAAGLREFFVSGDVSQEFLTMLRTAPDSEPWAFGFGAVHRELGQVIGSGAFKGPPDAEGMVEIAYAVVPSLEGRGYATEIAGALIERALEETSVRLIRAHTLPVANASTRVLRKCGLRHVGEMTDPQDGPVWRWERTIAPPT